MRFALPLPASAKNSSPPRAPLFLPPTSSFVHPALLALPPTTPSLAPAHLLSPESSAGRSLLHACAWPWALLAGHSCVPLSSFFWKAQGLLPRAGNEAQSLKVFTYPPPGLLWGLRRLDPSRDYKAHSVGLRGGSDGTGDRYLWGKWFISLASLSTISALYSLPHCMQPCTCFPWSGVTEA